MERGEPEDGVGCGASGVVQELRDSRDDQLGKFGDHPAAAGRIAVEADGVRPENVRAVELERLCRCSHERRPGGELEHEYTVAYPTTVQAVPVCDISRLEFELFKYMSRVMFSMCAISVLCTHMYQVLLHFLKKKH